MNTSVGPRIKKISFCLAMPALLTLAGCQGTLHTRWVEQADSYDHWSPLMNTMPIEVHGAIPGTTSEETIARIPQGTTAEGYASRNPETIGLSARARVVVYIGGNKMPTDGGYCMGNPTLRSTPVSHDKVMVASALCDGPRLVVRSRRMVNASDLSASSMASSIRSIKSQLLYGLEVSTAQQPTEQDNG